MLDSIGKLLANVSAPIAGLFAVGYLAQVVNLYVVARQNYNFGYITAWHVASVIDRTVVIGIGLKYFVVSWLVAIVILLATASLRGENSSAEDAPLPSSWVFFVGGPTPVYIGGQEPPDSGKNEADSSSLWLGSVLLAVGLALAWLIIVGWFFPTPVAKNPGDREVLSYLPYVNMTLTDDTEEADNSADGEGQPFTGTARPSDEETEDTYAVTGSIDPVGTDSPDEPSTEPKRVEGILLSHNSDYWYVFAEEGAEEGTAPRRLLVIPAARTDEICVVRGNTSAQAEIPIQERDCTY